MQKLESGQQITFLITVRITVLCYPVSTKEIISDKLGIFISVFGLLEACVCKKKKIPGVKWNYVGQFCTYSFVRHERMRQFTNIEYRHGFSKLRCFRKVWNRMPFYHRITGSLFNGDPNQSNTRLFILCFRICTTRFGILFIKKDTTSCDLLVCSINWRPL